LHLRFDGKDLNGLVLNNHEKYNTSRAECFTHR
jgi:hypothetical protein